MAYTYTQAVYDAFTGSSLNLALWNDSGNSPGSALSVSGGVMSMVMNSANGGSNNNANEVEADTLTKWDLTTGIWGVKWSHTGTASADTSGDGNAGSETYFGLWSGAGGSGPYVEIQAYPASNTWYVIFGNTSGYVTGTTGNQNAFGSAWSNGAWLGIGNYNLNGDNRVQFYSSPDGVTWTEIGSCASTGSDLDFSDAGIYLGTFQRTGSSNWVSQFQDASFFTRSGSSSSGGGGSGGATTTGYGTPTTVAGVIAQVPWLCYYPANGNSPPSPASSWPDKNINMANIYLAWEVDVPTYVTGFITACQALNVVPFIELEPWNINWVSGTVALFSDITSGVYDSWLTSIGSAIAAANVPVILTFAHEMNVSGQYPWSQGDTGSGPGGGTLTPAEWVAGWEYVTAKVNSTANGLAVWMWACSAYTGGSTVSPAAWWPNPSTVQMVGVDGYPSTEYGTSLGTFAGQIQPTVTIIRGLGWTGPILMSETNLAQMSNGGVDTSYTPPVAYGPGESITSLVENMYAAGISGIVEWENYTAPAGDPSFQMTAAQWSAYDSAIAANYGGSTSVTPPSGGGSGGSTTGSLLLVQDTGVTDASSVAFAKASTAGNTLIAVPLVYIPSGGTWPTSVTDNAGNTWAYPTASQNGPPPGALNEGYPLWLSYALDAASATTFSFTLPGNWPQVSSLSEWQGITGLGAGAGNAGTTSTAPTVTVPYANGDLVVAAYYGSAASMGTPSGFLQFPNSETNNTNVSYQVMSGAGNLTITWPSTSAGWAAVAQAFTTDAGAGSGPTLLMFGFI